MSEVVGTQLLNLSASPITGVIRSLKAVHDLVLARLILLLISPLMLMLLGQNVRYI